MSSQILDSQKSNTPGLYKSRLTLQKMTPKSVSSSPLQCLVRAFKHASQPPSCFGTHCNIINTWGTETMECRAGWPAAKYIIFWHSLYSWVTGRTICSCQAFSSPAISLETSLPLLCPALKQLLVKCCITGHSLTKNKVSLAEIQIASMHLKKCYDIG